MANATPVHNGKKGDLKDTPKDTPKDAPKDGIKEVAHHPVVSPGQTYRLPDGTVVRDN